jgi:hypothetical protein
MLGMVLVSGRQIKQGFQTLRRFWFGLSKMAVNNAELENKKVAS